MALRLGESALVDPESLMLDQLGETVKGLDRHHQVMPPDSMMEGMR
ncbi:MAG: hypothetical protein ABTR54_17345 [Candidatus Competibacter sp.]|jgi:hypothetical protein|nr:hypothetical protein [Candidatus Competibacter sp.]HUM91045.1 hypothetical protein [Candidatus Competibacter sp.]